MLSGSLSSSVSAPHGEDPDSPFYNPFAGHSGTSFTSAFQSHVDTRPVVRRRGSEGAARRSRNDHDPWRTGASSCSSNAHSRARTVDSEVGSSTSANLHPLRSPPATDLRLTDSLVNETRPRLRHLLSREEQSCGSDFSGSSTTDSTRLHDPTGASPQRLVIVHKVAPADSLAGVAVKYGISLADLRRVNQLWASDPIHLRKVLYIPLEKALRAKECRLSLLELDGDVISPPDRSATASKTPDHTSEPTPTQDSAHSRSPGFTIQRVPASQLSFFPPPAINSPAPYATTASATSTSRRRNAVPDEFKSSASESRIPPFISSTSLLSPALPTRSQITSFFSVLPIASSTLMARLSSESGRSTSSLGSEEQDHEMDEVGVASQETKRRYGQERNQSQKDRRDKAGRKTNESPRESSAHAHAHTIELDSYPRTSSPPRIAARRPSAGAPHGNAVHISPHLVGVSGYSNSKLRTPQTEVVRTSQMEPSPAMTFPLRARREKDNVT